MGTQGSEEKIQIRALVRNTGSAARPPSSLISLYELLSSSAKWK